MKEFLYTLLVDFGPRFLELALFAFGIWLISALQKQGVTKEQLALVEEAYAILQRAARTTNQIWVEAAKEAGGKLSKEEVAKAREDTINTFKEMITESMELALEKLYGSVDKWIEMNLESAVNEAKNVYSLISEEGLVEGDK